MKHYKLRYIVESILFALLLLVIGIGWQIVQGMLLTKRHVPDIAAAYANVDVVQSSVSFGAIVDRPGWLAITVAFVLAAGLYYAVRSSLYQRRYKGKE